MSVCCVIQWSFSFFVALPEILPLVGPDPALKLGIEIFSESLSAKIFSD
jgi:hypothetical protein